jgi:predicted MFS family arabinose efflux permease
MPLRWVMLLVLFLVRLAMGYQFQSVASVSSHLVTELGLTYTQVGTLIGFFLLPGIFISIPSGTLTRAVRDKNLLMLGALAMIAGALIMASAEGADALYVGRLTTGIGGSIFNVILTKMVTDWFIEHEIVTALAVMLTAWPIGISLGLVSQGAIADAYGWSWAMHATGILAFVALILTATLYRDPPGIAHASAERLRIGLPSRQFVHIGLVGIGWTLYNAAFIIFVSFVPDVLVQHGYEPGVALLSIPFGGRVLEVFGWITTAIVVTLSASALVMAAVSQGAAPEMLSVAFGVISGIPAGALMALSAEALTSDNRGPGLGIFYTWYYVGMTVSPAVAGWARDVSGNVAAPVLLGASYFGVVILCVALLRLLQATWPIEAKAPT